jgi:hypothetical protein
MNNIKRWLERQMISTITNAGNLDDLPDWVWDAVFELFTYE